MPTRKIADLEAHERCTHPEHNPPRHRVYDSGVWEHTCPACHHVQRFTVRNPVYVHRPLQPWDPFAPIARLADSLVRLPGQRFQP